MCIGKELQASQVALLVKKLPANAGDIRNAGLIPGSRRSPGGRHTVHSNILERESKGQEYWSGLSIPSPSDLPDPRIKLASPVLSLAWQADF